MRSVRQGFECNVTVDKIESTELDKQLRLTDTALEPCTSDPDGLTIALMRIGSRKSDTTASPIRDGGMRLVVLTGNIRSGDDAYGPLSVLFTSA
jgi:hypothetical protein